EVLLTEPVGFAKYQSSHELLPYAIAYAPRPDAPDFSSQGYRLLLRRADLLPFPFLQRRPAPAPGGQASVPSDEVLQRPARYLELLARVGLWFETYSLANQI